MPDKNNPGSSTPVTPQSPQTQWNNHDQPVALIPLQNSGEWQHPSWPIPATRKDKRLVVTEDYKKGNEETYDLELDLIIGKEIDVLERELSPKEIEENLQLAFRKMHTHIDDAIAQGKAKRRERKPRITLPPFLHQVARDDAETPFRWDFWNTPKHTLAEPDIYTDPNKYRDLFTALPVTPPEQKISTSGAPGSFTNWYASNGNKYSNRIEAYRAWQSYPLEIPGESAFDRHMRMAAAAAWDSKSDMAGSMSFGGFGSAIEIEEGMSPWSLAPVPRGFAIEKILGANLQPGFPTIDRFIDGEVASIKSIDLTAPSYQKASFLRSKLNEFIRKIEKFERGKIKKFKIEKGNYKSKALVIAIQKGAANHEQMLILRQAVETAASKGINLTISQLK